jgi:RNA polymerase sigma-54 factor
MAAVFNASGRDDRPNSPPLVAGGSVKAVVVLLNSAGRAPFERLLEISQDWPEDNYTSGSKPSSNRIDEASDRAHDMIANITEKPQSLHDHLLDQFSYFTVPREIRDFGEFLIQNLDHHGRLQSPLNDLIQLYGRHVRLEDAQQSLSLIQKLEPAGVGARDAKECLLLQLKEDTPFRDVLAVLITQHL